jgi:hypothetical protein
MLKRSSAIIHTYKNMATTIRVRLPQALLVFYWLTYKKKNISETTVVITMKYCRDIVEKVLMFSYLIILINK